MRTLRPATLNSVLAVVIAAAGVAVYLVLNPVTQATADAVQLTGMVQQGTVSATITASGSTSAVREANASFAIAGTVKRVKVAVGDTVKKGATLATLETDDLDSAVSDATDTLAKAEEKLDDAQDDLTDGNNAVGDAKKLSKSDPTRDQQLTTARAAVTTAKQAIKDAESQVEDAQDAVDDAEDARGKAKLTAPLSGVVIAVSGQAGGSVQAGSTTTTENADSTGTGAASSGFVTIADVSEMTITAAISEADIDSVAIGQSVAVDFPALPDVTTTATITQIAPTATTSNSVVTYPSIITLDEIPAGLRLGQTADVTITTATSAADALYVVTAAITAASDGTSTVDVVDDEGVTTTTTVTTGVVGDQGTEILSGLTAGQTIVIGSVAASTDEDDTSQFPGGGDFPAGGLTGGGGFTGGGGGGGFTGGPPAG